jgi:hypothetical protein
MRKSRKTQAPASNPEAYYRAYQEACLGAYATGMDHGIENNAFGFRSFMLPRPENRSGHELRCEVVTPELAKGMRRADGSFAGGGK